MLERMSSNWQFLFSCFVFMLQVLLRGTVAEYETRAMSILDRIQVATTTNCMSTVTRLIQDYVFAEPPPAKLHVSSLSFCKQHPNAFHNEPFVIRIRLSNKFFSSRIGAKHVYLQLHLKLQKRNAVKIVWQIHISKACMSLHISQWQWLTDYGNWDMELLMRFNWSKHVFTHRFRYGPNDFLKAISEKMKWLESINTI